MIKVSVYFFLMVSALTLCRAETPNILVVVADDLGVVDLSCYGSDYYKTPAIDSIAAQGLRFTRAYSAASVCSPTRASILTGRYPHRVHLTDALPWDRLFENPKKVPPCHLKELPVELPNIAQAMQAAGYRTALFGKWHLGNEEQFFTAGEHVAYGFDIAEDCSWKERARDKGVDELTAKTIRFLETNKQKPFLLFLMHHVPHVPIASPKEAQALYDDVPKGRYQKNQKYAGMISHLDQSIQQVLDKLIELGLYDNTILVFTSDNGGLSALTSNLPFRGGKGDLFEGGVRVPLLVRWPEHIEPGSVSDSAVISTDYFPTFLDLVEQGLMPSAHIDGKSMLPLWMGEAGVERRLYWHFPHRAEPSSALMDGDWKLIHHIAPNDYKLFNLASDPDEKNDLAVEYPEKMKRYKKMLEAHLQASGAQRMRSNPSWDPERARGWLRNFGVFYPVGGKIYQKVTEEYPEWFKFGIK
ncbi:sulfatase [Coraliomargarita sp. SDUM461004]|uniref:Sulfatase n=1 Tax=Thalassobacterium sedimentorum TaxID=3041258 RepID=A0ABU1AMF1_9BACT|nr:sulfatase [Coraliomargarita sp. SDUM461004]MDQ8195977.1 sulfatase [Coraliomargarita sp. SDUM461004]